MAALTEQMEKSDNDMRSKLIGLTEQLYQKEEESKQLHESLRKAEETAHDAKLAVQESKAAAAALAAKKETEGVINATAHWTGIVGKMVSIPSVPTSGFAACVIISIVLVKKSHSTS